MVYSWQKQYRFIMRIRHLYFIVCFLALTGTQAVLAEDANHDELPQVLTIDEAVRLALENNLNLRRSALDVQTRQRNADRSWNTLLPNISASAMASHPSSITGPIEPADRNVWTPGFSLSAGLTFSTSIIENIKGAKADYELGLLSYDSARQELELQVRKLFYQIILLDANRELADLNFASAQDRYERSAARVSVGQAPRLDELSARVDMENQRPSLRNAELVYENALDSFKAILGLPSETIIHLDGSLTGEFNESFSTAGSALNTSLEAASLAKSIQSLEAQRNAIRNNAYIPNLRLSWSSTPLYNIPNELWSDNGSFSITLGINLDNFFPWSSAKTQIENLNNNIQSVQLQLTDSLRNQENRINNNVRIIERIVESLEATMLNVDLAQSTYVLYEEAYRMGAADFQQLRSAGDSLNQARNSLLQEQYNLISALLDLEKELNIPFGALWSTASSGVEE